MSAKAGSNLNTVSMTPTLEENIKNVESKIKGIPTVSAKTGLNLNTVSMTQTRKNNTGGESKIKGVPSVSVKADSNLNTVSMTPTLKLKNTKEVPLQLPGISQQINGHFTSPRSARGCKNKQSLSVLPEKGNMEQEHIIVCQLQLVCVPIQPRNPGRREDVMVDSGAQVTIIGLVKIKIGNQLYTEEFQVATIQRDCKSLTVILVHREKSIMDKAPSTLMFDGQIFQFYMEDSQDAPEGAENITQIVVRVKCRMQGEMPN